MTVPLIMPWRCGCRSHLLVAMTLLLPGPVFAVQPGDFATPEFQVNTHVQNDQRFPALGADAAGHLIVAWQSRGQSGPSWSVVAQRYDARLQPVSTEQMLNAPTGLRRDGPAVAMADDGRFVAAWHGAPREGMPLAVHLRDFSTDGAPQSFDQWASRDFGGQHVLPGIGMAGDGRFTLVWDADGAIGNTFNVLARDFDAAGVELGAVYTVNQHTASAQRYSRVDANRTGDRVIAWQSSEQDGSGWGVFARCLPAGGPAGDEFQVNQFTPSHQARPEIAVAADGTFAITWYDNRGLGFLEYARVNLRVYGADCQPLGDEMQVNPLDQGIQDMPAITVDANGHYTVVWPSFDPDDFDSQGIYGRRFDALGQPLGDQFKISEEVEAYQDFPAVQALPDGGFIVAWETLGQDGSGFGVYARRYFGPQAAAVTAAAGSSQATDIGTDFAHPLVVQVIDQWGQPLAGVAVTFHSTAAGPGVLFPNGEAEIVIITDDAGQAAVQVTANALPGAHVVDITIEGDLPGPVFELVNHPAGAVPQAVAVNALGLPALLLLGLLFLLATATALRAATD